METVCFGVVHLLCLILPMIPVVCFRTAKDGTEFSPHNRKDILNRMKRDFSNYNTKLIPRNIFNTPLAVETQVFIDDINSFSATDMDFRIDFYLLQRWVVSRKVCETYLSQLRDEDVPVDNGEREILVPQRVIKMLWTPDTYVTNAKSSSTPSNIPPTKYLKISIAPKTCNISYNLRLAGIIACQMDFRDYPVDIQNCPLVFRSYSHSSDILKYMWKNEDPVAMNPEMLLLQHEVHVNRSERNGESFGRIFSHLVVICQFSRHLDFYFTHVYTPSTLIVILSWFNFWLGQDVMAGRISLNVSSLLALVTQFAGVKKDLPPIAYVNSVDIWMVTCMGFVIGSLLEVTLVQFMQYKKRKIETRQQNAETGQRSQGSSRKKRKDWTSRNKSGNWFENMENITDSISRILFPFTFVAFNCVYWPLLLNR